IKMYYNNTYITAISKIHIFSSSAPSMKRTPIARLVFFWLKSAIGRFLWGIWLYRLIGWGRTWNAIAWPTNI
ncbi:hypothetical protein DW716_20470, partial [Absiella sp. AM27-20]